MQIQDCAATVTSELAEEVRLPIKLSFPEQEFIMRLIRIFLCSFALLAVASNVLADPIGLCYCQHSPNEIGMPIKLILERSNGSIRELERFQSENPPTASSIEFDMQECIKQRDYLGEVQYCIPKSR